MLISHEIVQLKKEGATTNYHSTKKNMKAANNLDLLIEFKVAFSLKSLSKVIFNVIDLASEYP